MSPGATGLPHGCYAALHCGPQARAGAVEPPALLTLDTACVYLKEGGAAAVGFVVFGEPRGGGVLGVKRRKSGGGGQAVFGVGEVINIQQLGSSGGVSRRPQPHPPPVCPLHARKQMECERAGRRLQPGFIQLAGLSK